MIEEWKDIEQIPGYMVSSFGRVMNYRKGNIINGRINKRSGYREINVIQGGKHKYYLVHRLVASAFCKVPDAPGEYEVNHIDGDRTNNRAGNLEWITHAENLRHSYLIGNRENDVSPKAVTATNIETGEKRTFSSIYKAARSLSISQGNICLCCKGVRPSASGFYWQYAEGES